jgi:hypothetical protein
MRASPASMVPKKFASSFLITSATREWCRPDRDTASSSSRRPPAPAGTGTARAAPSDGRRAPRGAAAADDVLFLLRSGIDVFVDGHRAGPDVVGDAPQPPAVVRLRGRTSCRRPRPPPRRSAAGCRCGSSSDALQRRRRTLQPHAGVDVLAGQRAQVVRRIADAVELGEHQVPDLDRARSRRGRRSRCTARRRRPGPWLGAPAGQKLSSSSIRSMRSDGSRPRLPDPGRLVVVQIDRDGQPVRVDAQPLLVGQKLPGPVDRLALEVIAEAEVAQHLEERVVIGGAADVVDVAGAEALLAGRGPGESSLTLPRKWSLNWFMPAGVNSTEGSQVGTSTSLGWRLWPLD